MTLSYLNTLIGTTSKSEEYWKILAREISVKFPNILKENEKENLFEVVKREKLMFPCLKLILQMTAIQISEDALEYHFCNGHISYKIANCVKEEIHLNLCSLI